MARITVEDCLEKVDNRFKLIHLAAKRVRQLRKGADPLVESKNTDIVVSLREIAAGVVYESENNEELPLLSEADQNSDLDKSPEEAAQDSPVDDKTDGLSNEEAPVEK